MRCYIEIRKAIKVQFCLLKASFFIKIALTVFMIHKNKLFVMFDESTRQIISESRLFRKIYILKLYLRKKQLIKVSSFNVILR